MLGKPATVVFRSGPKWRTSLYTGVVADKPPHLHGFAHRQHPALSIQPLLLGGIRQAIGMLLPVLVLGGLFGQYSIGLVATFGAQCLAIIDQPDGRSAIAPTNAGRRPAGAPPRSR